MRPGFVAGARPLTAVERLGYAPATMDVLNQVVRRDRRQRSPGPPPTRDRLRAGSSATDVLMGLQRRLGNHAVARIVTGARSAVDGPRAARGGAPSPVLQRMNLEQTRWAPQLASLNSRRRLVTDGRDANVYVQVLDRSGDRLTAQEAAAVANARLGERIDDEASRAWGLGSNEKWTRPGEPLNDARQRTLDPFFYGVRVPFDHEGQTEQLELYFQHAAAWTAYIQAIFDTSNPATKPLPTMYDVSRQRPNLPSSDPIPREEWRAYSNVHDVDPRARRSLFERTTGGEAHHFDAYTKVVGEGARWQCVRTHARHLRDDSLFFVAGRRGTVYGVTFETLWKSWKKVFNKRFNIPDRTVADRILDRTFDDEGYTVVVNPRRLTTSDYDLDRGRSYEPEEEEPTKRKRDDKADEDRDKKRKRPLEKGPETGERTAVT